MIGILIGPGVLAAFLTHGSAIFVPAAVNVSASVWSNGVLANYRTDPQAAPNWAATVSMLTALAAVVLIALSFVVA